MRFRFINRRALLTASILVSVLLLGFAPDSQAVERLRVTVGDTTGTPGQHNSVVTVFLTNTVDQIAAFTVHLVLNRTDIANFQTDVDTVIDTTYWDCQHYTAGHCDDSVAVDYPDVDPWDMRYIDTVPVNIGSFDTVGTLISGWEYVDARSVSTGDLGLDIKLTARADPHQAGHHPPIYPQQGGVLFRLLADIFPIPPSQVDRTVGISIDVSWKPYFSFSTPSGTSIGWIQVPEPDTNYYMCTVPVPPPGSGCYTWTKVHSWECPEGGCDSIGIDTVYIAMLDPTQVKVYDGQIEVGSFQCGDCNASGGEPTIGDVALLIDHLFITGAPIEPVEICNTNCSTEIPVVLTIGDVAVLIDRLFITQTRMCCE